MNIGSIGNSMLYNQVHQAKESQNNMASSTLKSAMQSPKQYLNLLEASVSVKNSIQLAQGIGINVDTTV